MIIRSSRGAKKKRILVNQEPKNENIKEQPKKQEENQIPSYKKVVKVSPSWFKPFEDEIEPEDEE